MGVNHYPWFERRVWPGKLSLVIKRHKYQANPPPPQTTPIRVWWGGGSGHRHLRQSQIQSWRPYYGGRKDIPNTMVKRKKWGHPFQLPKKAQDLIWNRERRQRPKRLVDLLPP